ncbi:ionotropic glutamate receptor-invertebrate [Anopheles darlingi]|uniref:Ionotropic glutamate receptor-invertebrate n=1 Tax=Anopheles darlingi TaxID=43151 RepID=W5JST1_ANODA|nr:ionotropic glutamate receptor-invertebrate [Anopheles darlingi]
MGPSRSLVFVGILFLVTIGLASQVDQRVAAIRDILPHLDGTTRRLLAFIGCWPSNVRYQLWREINGDHPHGTIGLQFAASNDRHYLPWHDPNRHLLVVLVDLGCPRSAQLLQDAGHLLYYRLRWILLHSGAAAGGPTAWPDCTKYRETYLAHLPLLVSSEVYYICMNPITGQLLVQQQYRLSSSSATTVETVGHWESQQSTTSERVERFILEDRNRPVTSVRRKNFNRFELRTSLVVLHNETLNHLDDYTNKHLDTLSRVTYQLTKTVAQQLNASVRYIVTNSWGYRNASTGLYNGMIGELQRGRADLGGCALFFTQERIPLIDYLSMSTSTRAKFVFRAPKLSFTDNVFALPFDRYVWYCTISFIVLSGVLLAVVLRVEQQLRSSSSSFDRQDDPPLTPIHLSDTLLNSFGTTCQQGSFIEPKTGASRCLILLCLVVLMFLYASYSANIVALIQSPSTKIRTVEDLLASHMKTGAEDTVYNKYYFRHATDPIRKALYQRKIRNKDGSENFVTLARGVELLRQGLYALHVELGVCYRLISDTFQEEEKCGLQEVEYIKVIDPYYAVQKNSSFREPVRISLFQLREFGIQGREQAQLYTKKPRCSGGTSFTQVSIVDVWPALATLGWGYLLTLGVLIAEKLWCFCRRKLRSRGINRFD